MVEVLALIPARGGSKGVPGKNIKLLGGYPLIAFSIAAARRAEEVNRIIVSTDDDKIAAVAREHGAEVPFLRPAALAQDDSPDLPVFQHALEWLVQEENYHPDVVVQLRPTSPFRPPDLVAGAIRVLLDHTEADSVRGVVPSQQNPYKMWRIDEQGLLAPVLDSSFKEPYNMPRQALPDTYWQTGHIDVIRTDTIRDGSMSGSRIFAYQIAPRFSVDLDTHRDWQRASWQMKEIRDEIVLPEKTSGVFPEKLSLLVLDFDGVLTDDRVFVNQEGMEMVAAHRGDGMGIAMVKDAGIEVVILSREKNPVVSARAEKLRVPVFQGVLEKGKALQALLEDRNVSGDEVIYLGNDINDLPCFPLVGTAAAVADAHHRVLEHADLVLNHRGGRGAVRELCDLILEDLHYRHSGKFEERS